MRLDFDLEVGPSLALPFYALEGSDRDDGHSHAAPAARRRPPGVRGTIVRVARRFSAAPERVFAAWLDAATAGRWLFATASLPIAEVDIDARVGGAFRLVELRRGAATVHAGRYLQIVPPRRLVFALATDGARESTVTLDIVQRRNGCELMLSHQPVPSADRERTEGRWIGILYGLGLMLGEAKRHEGHTRSQT